MRTVGDNPGNLVQVEYSTAMCEIDRGWPWCGVRRPFVVDMRLVQSSSLRWPRILCARVEFSDDGMGGAPAVDGVEAFDARCKWRS